MRKDLSKHDTRKVKIIDLVIKLKTFASKRHDERDKT